MTPTPEHAIINIIINNKDIYNNYYKYISIDNKELKEILLTLEYLYATTEGQPSLEDLHVTFVARHQGLSKSEREAYDMIFNLIAEVKANPEGVVDLVKQISTKAKLNELALLCYDSATTGKSYDKVLTAVKQLEEGPKVEEEEFPIVTTDLDILYNEVAATPGLRWRLKSLNESLGSLRLGNFGFVFARPETGKTTFLASEFTFMAGQADGPCIWFNNEQEGRVVALRGYQAALGIPLERLFSDRDRYRKEFDKATGGNFILIDEGNITRQMVERVCERYKPRLVVIDQIDKIKGFNNDRNDLELGAIYIWARELAKVYCPFIGICQADGTAEGQKWLHMGHVANAKTAKQAEADWILGIGKTNDVGFEYVRHFNISKNKLFGDSDSKPEMRHGRWDVLIKPEIARYEDILS